jgi:hypothetical protein
MTTQPNRISQSALDDGQLLYRAFDSRSPRAIMITSAPSIMSLIARTAVILDFSYD